MRQDGRGAKTNILTLPRLALAFPIQSCMYATYRMRLLNFLGSIFQMNYCNCTNFSMFSCLFLLEHEAKHCTNIKYYFYIYIRT